MKKVTTVVISIAILLIVIATARVFMVQNNMDHNYSLKGVESADQAVKLFLEMMIPHHAEAVQTSKLVMMDQEVTSAPIRLFAAKVADAQEFEIIQMQGWYQEWFGTEYLFDPAKYHPMMSDMTNVKGNERAKIYLTDMIAHHESAIESAKETRELIEELQKKNETTDGDVTITNTHPGIDTTKLFTQKIEEVQAKEVAEMKELLETIK